ncbi:hypothetical protein DB354_21630 [Opitutus sp. ER46]|nr:hypothetical protein DB354_21630 [Opitutus sp. ER46]
MALVGDWRCPLGALRDMPVWADKPLPAQTLQLAGMLAASAPHPIVGELARILGVRGEPEALPWAVCDRLFRLAIAGYTRALDERHWSGMEEYGYAAMAIPGGCKLRQAVIEIVIEDTLVAAMLVRRKALAPRPRDAGGREPGELAEALAVTVRLLEVAAKTDQYPTLCDHLVGELMWHADDALLARLPVAGVLWSHFCALALDPRARISAPAREWLRQFPAPAAPVEGGAKGANLP